MLRLYETSLLYNMSNIYFLNFAIFILLCFIFIFSLVELFDVLLSFLKVIRDGSLETGLVKDRFG